jgi:hypothetical protein
MRKTRNPVSAYYREVTFRCLVVDEEPKSQEELPCPSMREPRLN